MTARQLAADYLWLVHAYAKKLSGTVSHQDLCGIGQVALVEAARKWPAFKKRHPQCQFRQYAGQRVKWRMLDAVRRHKALAQEDDDALNDAPDPLIDDDSRAHVHGLLNRLPALEKRVLKLAYGIGRREPATKDRIAAALHISPQKVRQILQSGIMRLRWDAVRGKA